MRFHRVAMACALAFPAVQAAHAQTPAEPGETLKTVTVTGEADRAATVPSLSQARAEAQRAPGGTDVIDAETVREGRVSTLQDVLGFSPGVVALPRFGSEETRLSIRGSGLQRTFHLRGIKLMQDGVPVTLTDGSGDFQAIEPLSARYVEVLRGANALQYGAATLGGAINYVSPTGHDAPGFRVRAEVGSFGYRREHLEGGGVSGAWDGFASFSGYQQDGYRDHARQEAYRFNGNLGYRLSPTAETRFYLGVAKSNSELPGNLTQAQLRANPRQANPGNISGDQRRDIEVLRLANKTSLALGDGKLELSAFWSHKDLFHPIFQVLQQDSDDYGLGLRWTSDAPLAGRRNRLIAGVQLGRGSLADDRFVNAGGQPAARTNQLSQRANSTELFVQNAFYLAPALALVAGLQSVRTTRDNRDALVVGAEGNEGFRKRYSGASPKLGFVWDVVPRAQVFGNVSRSYEPPSFGELTGGLRPNLVEAQKATTVELGTRGDSGALAWDAVVYHARLRDELLQTQVFLAGNGGVAAPQTVNVPRTIHEGVELGLTWRPVKAMEWRNAYTLNRFRFDGDPSFGNNELPGLPRHVLRSELTWRGAGGWYAGPTLTVAGRTATDAANTLYANGYTLVGFKLGQQVSKGFSWFIEGRNLADKAHAASVGVVRQATPATAQFLPGDGRSVYAGVQWAL